MPLTTITIKVPDGDRCSGCEYLIRSWYEDAMRCGHDEYSCAIFKCKIRNGFKCIGCKICARMDGENE